ncbi:hydantoinase/oxoprolinase family protein [Pseudomonas sp. LFM046]|uniref:hydantoinase/oxoprolinase family protein n=1 Tax=Pseudomonas sp. LFM046 TaxID=1608357 RepID=UPI0005CFB8F6|nr:hydantoinase/oxoprolinase family protein [Pseudomonas sp. LFM046]
MSSFRIATDVGGTFTDLVAQEISDDGKFVALHTAKADTTPGRFEQGIVDVLAKAKLPVAESRFFVHGTTVVINALTERKGARTGLITTAGFRDVLEIGRGSTPDYFNIKFEKPEPFVRRKYRRVLDERIDYLGNVLVPLDLEPLQGILADFRKDGIEAIAICFLNGYVNPEHERRVYDAIRESWPEVSVIASHQITREWREYERTCTTVLSAYVQPSAARYIDTLDQRLAAAGMESDLHIMQSNGGIDTREATVRNPISIVESGPASGVHAAAALGMLIGRPNIIALDIGGTTAKCALIEAGSVPITTEYYIEKTRRFSGYPILTPTIDIVEIGNGGGSIAWIDEYNALHVGPKSAAADPGPVAYGRGGTEPTTTDANLLTGRIGARTFCGGTVRPDLDKVETAFARIGDSVGLSALETARGVLRVANNNMINALKLISVNRGHDPRDFSMVVFGGGGAMHGAFLARELLIPTVIVPANAAVFSAWGMLMADLRRDHIVTMPTPLVPERLGEIVEAISALEQQARTEYQQGQAGLPELHFEYFADVRYDGQENTVKVVLPPQLRTGQSVDELLESFREQYERKYGYRLDSQAELVNLHLVGVGSTQKVEFNREAIGEQKADAARIDSRQVDFDVYGTHQAAIYDRDKLLPGMRFTGPAIVEESGTTIVVLPGDVVDVDAYRTLLISIAAEVKEAHA